MNKRFVRAVMFLMASDMFLSGGIALAAMPPSKYKYARYAFRHLQVCQELAAIAPYTYPLSYPNAIIPDSSYPCEWVDDSEAAVDRRFRLYYARLIYLEMIKNK